MLYAPKPTPKTTHMIPVPRNCMGLTRRGFREEPSPRKSVLRGVWSRRATANCLPVLTFRVSNSLLEFALAHQLPQHPESPYSEGQIICLSKAWGGCLGGFLEAQADSRASSEVVRSGSTPRA